jgi:predicted transcriptional regulator
MCSHRFGGAAMPKTTTMTVRLTPELSDKLEALARDTKRSKSYLAGEAIASYVEMNAWQVARIKAALAEARSGAPGVPHEEIVRWVESWGTVNERRRPRPRKPK